MTIIPNQIPILDYIQDFKKLIFANYIDHNPFNNHPIISYSQEIEPLDPLVFLSVLQGDNQPIFYWQNQRKKDAIASIGAIKSLTISGNNYQEKRDKYNRFQQCQKFINHNQKLFNIINEELEDCQPHFFTYFRFFEEDNNGDNQSFPSATIFLPLIQLIKKENKYFITINTNKYNQEINNYLSNDFSRKIELNYQINHQQNNQINHQLAEAKYQTFIDKVNQGLDAIALKKLSKIVVAHALEIKRERKFNLIKSLENLRSNHPDCYIFAIGNENNQYFIGASPERLLSIKDNQLVSDALAGSAPRGNNDEEDDLIGYKLLENEKEKREHQAVTNFIFNQLNTMGLEAKKASLQLLKLSNIQHLWTPIYAEIRNNINPLEIVSKLHPTPAVAGDPIDVACQEIEASEKFDRTLYAAPIGWLDLEGNCEFIVGIRSALIKDNYARLYAGAGIVTGSKPEQELTEIKLKFQALLQALI